MLNKEEYQKYFDTKSNIDVYINRIVSSISLILQEILQSESSLIYNYSFINDHIWGFVRDIKNISKPWISFDVYLVQDKIRFNMIKTVGSTMTPTYEFEINWFKNLDRDSLKKLIITGFLKYFKQQEKHDKTC